MSRGERIRVAVKIISILTMAAIVFFVSSALVEWHK